MPGAIDNRDLERRLVIDDNKDRLRKNVDYYLISQRLWEFFFNLYGGGPSIKINLNTSMLESTSSTDYRREAHE